LNRITVVPAIGPVTAAEVDTRRIVVDESVARDRATWADHIHDGVTQVVTSAVLELASLEGLIRRDPTAAVERLSATKAELRSSLSDLRHLLFELQPPQGGLSGALDLPGYVKSVAERWDVQATVSLTGVASSSEPGTSEVLEPVLGTACHVIREGVANAAKHADAPGVDVRVQSAPDGLIVEVADAGKGFVPGGGDRDNGTADSGADANHYGLGMMHRRVAEVGGTLRVDSEPGRGTRVVARLPAAGSCEGGHW
jgi:signal transduction histidine kinase